MAKKIPITYAYLYFRLKEKSRGNIIRTDFLKEKISYYFCWSKDIHKGLPRSLMHDIIKDLEYFGLVLRLDHMKYKILPNSCENKIKKFLW